jgi:hypothetical protein
MADAEDDATYIVEQTVNDEMFAGALTALGPIIAGAIENDLRLQGITVSDMETFSQIVFEEFLGGFTDEMQTVTVQFYLETFTEDELGGIARFLRSDPGQAYVHYTPELMKFGSQQGERIGGIAAERAGPRIAARLEREGVEIAEQSMMEKLIDALR